MNAISKPVKSKQHLFIPETPQIEYKVLTDEVMKMDDLVKMGKDGWIFCHVFNSSEKNQYLFQRQKQ